MSGTIYDPDVGDIETIYYRIDGTTGQAGTQLGSTITANGTNQSYSGSINVSTLTEGTHTLYVWVQDNYYGKSAEAAVPFKVDKSAPSISVFGVTSSSNSINISNVTASDSVPGLDPYPYRYTVGSNISSWLSSTSYTKSALTPNTQYTVKAEVRDKVGHIAGSSTNIYTKALVPMISITDLTSSSLVLNVLEGNPTGTWYQVKTGSFYVTQTCTLSLTPTWITIDKTLPITGLSPNTPYTFTAYAKDGAGIVTAASAPATGTTLVALPATPANLTYTAATGSITVSWPAVTGAVTYSINIDNGSTIISNYPSTNYTHAGLAPGVQHTYSVRAENSGGASNWSTPLTAATKLEIPANITATSTETSITLAWSPVTNATGYEVNVDGIVTSTSDTNITVGGLNASTQHTYDIRAKNSVSYSDWSSEQDKLTRLSPPGVPADLSATSANTSITITWGPVADATAYQVSADGIVINSGAGASYVDTGLTPGTAHTYMVRAVNSGGKSAWSSPVNKSTIPLNPNVPANLSAAVTDTDITVSWDPVVNASSYLLEIEELRQNVTDSVYNQTISDLVFDISVTDNVYSQSVTPGSIYIYKVRAEIGGVPGDWSPSITVTPGLIPGGIPQNLSAAPSDTSVSLIWDSVSGASSYDIEENGLPVGSIRAVTFTHDGLIPDTEYTYRVRAVNSAGAADWSNPLTVTTLANPPLGIPGNIIGTPTVDAISLLWGPVDGATGYEIVIDDSAAQSVTQSIYTLTGLTPNTQHTFRVRAVNSDTLGAWSGVLTVTTLSDQPSTPTTGVATADYTANVLQGDEFILVLTASDVQNLSSTSFSVTYNPDELDVEDLYATTSLADTAVGNIPGSDLNVTQLTPGNAVFTLSTPLSQGQSFTGLVTTIRFKSKINGSSVITYSVNQGGSI